MNSKTDDAEDSAAPRCYLLTDEEAAIAFEALGQKRVADRCECDTDVGFVCRRCRKLDERGIDVYQYEIDLASEYGKLVRRSRLQSGK